MKQPAKKVYRSANGKIVDMDLLRQRNELTPAVGNAKVNARGDELGKGGKIIRKREEVLRDYYESSQASVQDEVIARNPAPQPVQEETKKTTTKKVTKKAQEAEAQDAQDEWVEDADGNFVKKGE